jgi:PKD repeat protein
VTEQGIWAGSDTDRFNNELRARLAFFPFTGGSAVPANDIGELPNDVVSLGNTVGTVGTVDTSVLYRINAGGPLLTSVDDGPNWLADTASTSPYRTSGSNPATAPSSLATPYNDAAVPRGDLDRAPAQLWTTERNDPAGGDPMNWSFPVAEGTPIQVRLYLANRNASTDNIGYRVFDVILDGVTVLDDLDLSGQVGHNFGTMRAFDVVSDGSVNIDFVNVVNNPLVNGIEIIRTDIAPDGTFGTQDAVTIRQFDGTTVTGSTTVDGTIPWRTVRGAFMVNASLYTLHLDGTLMERSFDGVSFGPGRAVDMWANTIMSDAPTMTGMFYDPSTSRVYYTLSGQSSLFYRTFLPESGVFHAQRFVATGSIAALNPARVRGMFLGNGQLWFSDSTTGNLLAMPFVAGEPSGAPTVADATVDWRSRALFRSSGAQPNVAPVAAFSSTCEENVCTFDASGSTDTDGTITGYAWDFGDGSTSTGVIAQHSYAAAGTYTVTLTATDNRNGTGTFSGDVVVTDPPNVAPTALATATCSLLSCTFTGSASSDSDGTIETYDWTFGDGSVGSGDVAIHDFVEAGPYTAVLTVTDDDGATSTAEVLVEAIAPSAAVLLRASAEANSQSATPTITVPSDVQAGDQLVYIVTANSSTTTTTPPGWTLIATSQDGNPDMTSWVFTRVADVSTAGSVVTLTLGTSAKTARTLLAYDNAIAPTTALSSVITGSSASLTTAPATIVYAGSTIVSYWSDKSGSNTGWTVPPTIDVRAVSVGSGSGRITAAIGDRVEPAGTWPGATATSTVVGTKGIGWTVVLQPATGNLSPTASFSASCNSLQCSFDANTSSDPDGTIVDHHWDFGDGTTGTGVAPVHAFPGDGTFSVTLTVTDNQSATSTSTTSVPVSLAVVTFRAANSSNQSSSTASVSVPAAVQAGDQLVLLIAANSATTVSTPVGWSPLGSTQAGAPDMVSLAFTRTADAATAGSTVQASLGTLAKVSTTLLAYAGAAPVTTAAVNVATTSRTAHTTPSVDVATAGSQVVSYWVDKTSGNTGWTVPSEVTPRSTSVGSGGGRITAAAGDTTMAAGAWPGATATSAVAGTKTIGWSIVVPAP